MIRFLEPRHFRLDDLLRQEHAPGRLLGKGPARTGETWGVPGALRLELCAEGGELIVPGGGVWRPSHASVFGIDAELGLQITQDAFVSDDGVLVCVLSLRNAGGASVEVSLSSGWLTDAPVRISPPGDDLLQSLPPAGRVQLVWASGRDRGSAEGWAGESSPVRRQTEALDDWVFAHYPRFECADQALRGRFYDELYAFWLGGNLSGASAVLAELLRPEFQENTLALHPNFANLAHFCVADWPIVDPPLTVVWDDPSAPGDFYDDGRKGLTLWQNRKCVVQQESAETVEISSGTIRA